MEDPGTSVPGQDQGGRRRKRRRERFVTHVGLLLVALAGIGGAGLYLGHRVIDTLPDVGKDLRPKDSWGAPLAIERRADGWLVAHVPPCARSPVAGVFLWNEASKPLWTLRGQAYPIDEFLIGATLPGLKVVHKMQEPSRGQVLRLGVLRSTGRPAGVTFRIRDLRIGKVRYRGRWLTVAEFKRAARCPKPKLPKRSTPTSPPITLPAQTLPPRPPPPTTFPPTSGP